MSFKDGIPLLATLDDEDDEASDVDITIEDRPSGTSKKWTRKQLLFSMVLAVAVFGVVIVIIGVTLTVLLLHNSHVGSPVSFLLHALMYPSLITYIPLLIIPTGNTSTLTHQRVQSTTRQPPVQSPHTRQLATGTSNIRPKLQYVGRIYGSCSRIFQ